MRSVLSGARELYQVDYRIRAKDGSYRWFMDRGRESAYTGSEKSIIKIVHDSIRPAARA